MIEFFIGFFQTIGAFFRRLHEVYGWYWIPVVIGVGVLLGVILPALVKH